MDAVRALALLLGICLHAGLSFVPGLQASQWPIRDTQSSAAVSLLIFVIHVFRMSVFFLIAGYLARGLLARLGTRGFVRNRAARIAAPLALGWVVAFVLIVAVAVWALARANGGRLPEQLPPGGASAAFNFLHLWFLYVLLWLYALALGLRWALQKLGRLDACAALAERALRTALRLHTGPLLLALPVGAALLWVPPQHLPEGVPIPAYTLIPPVISLFIYGYMFTIGWVLARATGALDTLAQRWAANAGMGLVAAIACLALLGNAPSVGGLPIPTQPQAYAICYAIALMCWSLAFVGAGMRYLNRPSRKFAYLADASYWMYLAHLPLVMALQTAFMLSSWHWGIKYALINLVAIAMLLASYHYGVRSSWVGQLLNGRRVVRKAGA